MGWEGGLWGVLVTTAATQLRYTLDMNVQGLELLPDDALRHATAQDLHQQPRTAIIRGREGVEIHILPIMYRSAQTAALKVLQVDGKTISFSALSLAVRPTGQVARSCWSPGRFRVVPSGWSFRSPDRSLYLRLLTV